MDCIDYSVAGRVETKGFMCLFSLVQAAMVYCSKKYTQENPSHPFFSPFSNMLFILFSEDNRLRYHFCFLLLELLKAQLIYSNQCTVKIHSIIYFDICMQFSS